MTIAEDLQAISTVLGALAPKEDGNLVRFNDWNDLVGQVDNLRGVVDTQQINFEDNASRILALETGQTNLIARVQAIDDLIGASGDDGTIISRLDAVEDDKLDTETFTQYQATLDPLLLQYTVTLETEDVSYLLGETATLTATARRLDGSSVSARPWLDFIVSWGDIQAVPGFDTRPGAGGRSVSVRTNSDGVARVRIKAENLAWTSSAIDVEMQAFFATEINSQGETKVMRQAMMDASDSRDNFMAVMYSETTQRYDSGSPAIRAITDRYYLDQHKGSANNLIFRGGNWNDHRSTIAVFAKDDSNPETPDFGKGVSSIQINFRDWIGPWIDDYGPDIPHVDGPWVVAIPGLLEDLNFHPDILIDYFDDQITGLGFLGKHKVMESMGGVIGRVDKSLINPGAGPLINVIDDAVKVQKGLDFVSYGDTAGTVRALAGMSQAVQQAAGTGAVKGQMKNVESQVDNISNQASTLETSYGVLNDRMNENSVQGESVMLALGSIDSKVGNINIVDADSVRGSVSAIKADIAAMRFIVDR
jgi:hypothetical protein